MRKRCPFCLVKFPFPYGESMFVLHLKADHGWGSLRSRQFIRAQEQCRAPEWMQRPAIEQRRMERIDEICSWDPGFDIDVEEMLHA